MSAFNDECVSFRPIILLCGKQMISFLLVISERVVLIFV